MSHLRFILLICSILTVENSLAQDRLLLTNGKIKNLGGNVISYDHEIIVYQTEQQILNEQAYVKRHEMTASEFTDREAARTASEETKLKIMRQKMMDDVAEKMKQLPPDEFEQWKNGQLLKYKEEETLASFKMNKKKKKHRFTRTISRDLVFSILRNDSTEIVVYSADTLGFLADGEAEMEYGVEEMRMYIKGRQDGRRHRTAFDAMMGAGVGSASSFLGAFWGPAVPATYIVVMTIANTKIKNKAGIEPGLLENPAYRDGYERSAKRKKTWDFVKGSVAGLGFGFVMWQGVFR